MVKVKPCPHVHAGGALVHQAEQARSLNARLRGVRGPVALSSPAVARVVRLARALPPAQAVRVLSRYFRALMLLLPAVALEVSVR